MQEMQTELSTEKDIFTAMIFPFNFEGTRTFKRSLVEVAPRVKHINPMESRMVVLLLNLIKKPNTSIGCSDDTPFTPSRWMTTTTHRRNS
jgi:hypothetical protein